jgi:hypothetical protein
MDYNTGVTYFLQLEHTHWTFLRFPRMRLLILCVSVGVVLVVLGVQGHQWGLVVVVVRGR